MSEEIIKRGYDRKGDQFGEYELFTIGDTNINALKKYRIVPNKNYGEFGKNKPDRLVVDRREPTKPVVLVVVEHKLPTEFNTDSKREAAAVQCVNNYCKPLDAKIGIITDGTTYIWLNPQISTDKGYDIALREDGYPIEQPFLVDTPENIFQVVKLIEKCLQDLSQENSKLIEGKLQNPSNLADRVWQAIWLASGENPDMCLATFVEIFLFKYLSDLGVLTQNSSGVEISFNATINKSPDKSLNFYFQNVRPYIKEIFPPSTSDGTSIINGIVLNPEIAEHNFIFSEILNQFEKFGGLRNIDPEFKSRLYENFLKKSISQKNWGQFFTPRNIIKAMIEMSGIKDLPSGARVYDPACGVGGFLLEPINTVRRVDYSFKNGKVNSLLDYSGYDRDQKTIILAKANMLIHLNELLTANYKYPKAFSSIFNKTFHSVHMSILGSLARIENAEYDLIMTNPPYVVTGTSTIKKYINDDGNLSSYYYINATGVEGLFLEKIIRSLKPNGRAFVVIPDGILNRLSDSKLRKFIIDECLLLAIISLPKNAFYTTPKKTYILCIQKKNSKRQIQNTPVFSYVVLNVGETLDASRFKCENDLPDMVKNYKIFSADPDSFVAPNIKCKIWPFNKFDPDQHWSVDRWWTKTERVSLGIEEDKSLTTPLEFATLLEKEREQLASDIERLSATGSKLPSVEKYAEICLSDTNYFELFIGSRVLRKDIHNKKGDISVYSANVKVPFGWMDTSNIADFTKPYVLWGIDGNFEFAIKLPGEKFRTTDHCGAIKIIDPDINPYYVYYALHAAREEQTLDRELRANLSNFGKLVLKFPIKLNESGEPMMKDGLTNKEGVKSKVFVFDLDYQNQLVDYYHEFEEVKSDLLQRASQLSVLEIPPITQ